MNCRQLFLSTVSSFAVQRRPAALQVAVMEILLDSAGPSVVMVHHATEATRTVFGAWLRTNSGASIICMLPDGAPHQRAHFSHQRIDRGLILMQEPIDITPSSGKSRNRPSLSALSPRAEEHNEFHSYPNGVGSIRFANKLDQELRGPGTGIWKDPYLYAFSFREKPRNLACSS